MKSCRVSAACPPSTLKHLRFLMQQQQHPHCLFPLMILLLILQLLLVMLAMLAHPLSHMWTCNNCCCCCQLGCLGSCSGGASC